MSKHYRKHKLTATGGYIAYKHSLNGHGLFDVTMHQETPQTMHSYEITLKLELSDARCLVRAMRQFIRAEKERLDSLANYTGLD